VVKNIYFLYFLGARLVYSHTEYCLHQQTRGPEHLLPYGPDWLELLDIKLFCRIKYYQHFQALLESHTRLWRRFQHFEDPQLLMGSLSTFHLRTGCLRQTYLLYGTIRF
jgi:hypothetical protein